MCWCLISGASIGFIGLRLALVRFGERLPLGFRHTKVLDDLLAHESPESRGDSTLYKPHFAFTGEEDAEPGSLEQLMCDGMR